MRTALAIAVTLALVAAADAQRRPHHPIKLFNGKDLSGWQGDPDLWSVVDGVITGVTEDSGPRKIDHNTFLIYGANRFEDFELTLKVRITGDNNSGIQYRSNVIDAHKFVVSGYQLDIHPRQSFAGMLYEEKGRGILARRGGSVRIRPGKEIVALAKAKVPAREIDVRDWNAYKITARGNRLVHEVNGEVTATVLDDDAEARSFSGSIALQLHAGAAMKVEAKDIVLRRLDRIHAIPKKPDRPQKKITPDAVPQWVSPPVAAAAREAAFFNTQWRPTSAAKSATLTITSGGTFTAYLNGAEVGGGDSWETAYRFDLTGQHRKVFNTLAIRVDDPNTEPGLVARVTMIFQDGSRSSVVSDGTWLATTAVDEPRNWKSAAIEKRRWQRCRVIGELGMEPWGNVFDKPETKAATLPPPDTPVTLPGFALEKIYAVPTEKQGSWVALARADEGRLVASAENGGLFFIKLGAPGGRAVVEKIDLPIGHANGLLWAFDSLYVCVNGTGIGGHDSGLYRLVDSTGDGRLDAIRTIKKFRGTGEHGPHGIALGPEPLSIYVVGGNRTAIPSGLRRSHPAALWGNDQLLPTIANGGDRNPAGAWICKTRADGGEWILHAIGLRNPYDLAFNEHGDLFTADADSPTDIGMPGFRPAAIYHVPSGADFGFRRDAENLAGAYPDITPATAELAPGSPAGIVFGDGAAFPAKYQEALFTCDWTRSTIDALHLEPDGASYRATSEPFLTGGRLRPTDLVIGDDGAMYFITGGRGEASALWRIIYHGDEPTRRASRQPFPPHLESKHRLRKRLGALQDISDGRVVRATWKHLSDPDPFLRNAARSVIEHHEVGLWLPQFAEESNPDAILGASIALARASDPDHHAALDAKLDALDFARLEPRQKVAYLRARGLAFTRLDKPDAEQRARLVADLSPHFPSGDRALDTELCRLLVYLRAPGIIEKTIDQMAAVDVVQAAHYASLLRNLKDGWTAEAKSQYQSWFETAAAPPGGARFQAFVRQIGADLPWKAPPDPNE